MMFREIHGASFAIAAACTLLGGCLRAQPSIVVARDQLARASSKADITELMGEPGGVVRLDTHDGRGCSERWAYSGIVHSGEQEVIFVDFDTGGRVCDFAWGRTNPALGW
jgi:hypothetical protein